MCNSRILDTINTVVIVLVINRGIIYLVNEMSQLARKIVILAGSVGFGISTEYRTFCIKVLSRSCY